jgi:hypothetical protein
MLVFQRNTLGYLGLRCDACSDARDAGPIDVLQELGWHVRADDNDQDLCPQCNPAHPVGRRVGRRTVERAQDS